MIPQMEPQFGIEEADAVREYVLNGGWLTEYKKTQELEGVLADYLNIRHVVMMPSGTMALYAALSVLDIGPGDYVLVPGLTMIATANAVTMRGAMPLFKDIEPSTLCMNLDDRVHPSARAMIYVSLNGRCGDMQEVVDFCLDHNLWLIEDAAQSLGSTWGSRALGTFGDIGCFSLSCQKIISTGNGGFCVTDRDDLAQKLRMFKDFGRERGGTDDYQVFGINLKFTDLQAVVGLEQMKKLPARIERKEEIWHRYYDQLQAVRGVEMLIMQGDSIPWFIDIQARYRRALINYLIRLAIGTRPFYPALHQTPVCKTPIRLPVCEDASQHGLWLPSFSHITDEQIDIVCDAIRDFYG